ncbi:MAG: hypothetical protein LBU28_05285, partial [Spirochaetaceae bacterium]|nr:hypothetical protein [Spirochaetaceae bacterium]
MKAVTQRPASPGEASFEANGAAAGRAAPALSERAPPEAGEAPLPSLALGRLLRLIDETFPLPRRFRGRVLAAEVGELSRLLTRERGERELGYLGKPGLLSAYLRYFLPWNAYRLCRLLPALDLPLSDGAALTDLGSGPLTFPLALWLCRPELRALRLEFRCLDRTGAALEAGKRLFTALAGADSPWTVKLIRASLGEPVRGAPAALVSAVNLYNEVLTPRGPLGPEAEKQARLLSALAGPGEGAVLVVEPGVPRSAEFIAALRTALDARGRPPRAPCPHRGPCPFPGGLLPGGRKGRWCHFAFETADAPRELHRLSAEAALPKERAVLSFLLAGPSGAPGCPAAEAPAAEGSLLVRVISDAFPLPGERASDLRFARYGCSARGLVLVTGRREEAALWGPGSLLRLRLPARERRDAKSGALI